MMRIMFVCLGNICRSPLAHVVMERKIAEQKLAEQIAVDSSGLGHWHVGEPSDPRTIQVARNHDLTLTHLAQQFEPSHESFDYIFAMDFSNLEEIKRILPKPKNKVMLFRSFDSDPSSLEVPDPYLGGVDGFEQVYKMIERNCELILEKIKSTNLPK